MKRLALLLAATGLIASPAFAQMNMNMPGMKMPGMKMPAPKKKAAPAKKKAAPAAKKAGKKATSAKKAPAPKRTAKKAPPKTPAAEDMSNMPGMEMPPGQTMPGMAMPPGQTMPGMEMPPGQTMPGMTMPADQRGGHAMAAEPPVAPPPPDALKGPANAADTVYGSAAMQPSRAFLLTSEHGGMSAAKLLVDQLETRVRKGRDGYFVNAEAWYGGDIDKLWLKTEIEGAYGRKPEQAELQALWSHAIDPWFNLQAGVRVDAVPRTRGRLVLGVEGLAPYWFEVNAAAFLSDKGDVTARAEAERSEDKLLEYVTTLQEQAHLLELAHVLVRDNEDRIIFWNKGTTQMYGWTRDEALGQNSQKLLRTKFSVPQEEIREELEARGQWEGELIHTRKDGSLLVVASHWAVHRNAHGQPVAVLEVNNDVTELKRLQEALRQSDRRKDEFLATLAHELRNPLAPIRNALHIMRLAPGDGDAVEDARAVIERQVQHMVRLIDDLLDLSRITRGKVQLRKQAVDLAQVVQSAVESSRPAIDEAGHQIAIQPQVFQSRL